MKILHVIMGLNEVWGGPPRALANLGKAQAERGDDVAILPCQTGRGPQTLDPGQHGRLTVHEPPTSSRLLWYDRKLKRKLRAVSRDRDIVHIHGTWRYHLLGTASVAQTYGIPYIVRPAGNMGRVTRRKRQTVKKVYFELFERSIYDRSAAIQCCSAKELRELEEFQLRSRFFVVPQPLGSDLQRTPPALEQLVARCPGLKKEDRVILFLGRIAQVKRVDVLLEAFIHLSGSFPGWHLLLAGPHENTEIVHELMQRIRDAHVQDRVSMPGMVTNGLKAACFARADVFAQPSLHENFGMSVAEALMFGLPCVVSNGIALAEDVHEHEAGIVCDSNVAAFENALRRLLSDESQRRRYCEAAKRTAQEFEPLRVAEQLEREYRTCLHDG